jgi:hypothetical protein
MKGAPARKASMRLTPDVDLGTGRRFVAHASRVGHTERTSSRSCSSPGSSPRSCTPSRRRCSRSKRGADLLMGTRRRAFRSPGSQGIRERGRGLMLVEALADRWGWTRRQGKTIWVAFADAFMTGRTPPGPRRRRASAGRGSLRSGAAALAPSWVPSPFCCKPSATGAVFQDHDRAGQLSVEQERRHTRSPGRPEYLRMASPPPTAVPGRPDDRGTSKTCGSRSTARTRSSATSAVRAT